MDILEFFEPVTVSDFTPPGGFEEATWSQSIATHTGSNRPDVKFKKMGIIGILSPDEKSPEANEIRKHLYALKKAEYAEEIVDLGNFKFDYSEKSYQSLGFALSEIISMGIIPIIINGNHDITYAQYLAFSYLKTYVNLTCVDGHIDFNLKENTELTNKNFLQKILLEEPSFLFHYSQAGYQMHYADTAILNFIEKLHFDMMRLGDAQANLTDTEPLMRNAHFVSIDMCTVRHADAPGTNKPGPNGFYNEEICQLSRYAGASDNVKTIGFYEYHPGNDVHSQTAQLLAQMIWYFADGYIHRYRENPVDNRDEFTKYITSINDNSYQLIFYKSNRTDKWWMEVPLSDNDKLNSTHIIPCSYNDYVSATKDQLPERWWQAMKKLS